jgi:hypothetical protein
MQRLEVSGAVRLLKWPFGVKGLDLGTDGSGEIHVLSCLTPGHGVGYTWDKIF